jgi:outer membrane protein
VKIFVCAAAAAAAVFAAGAAQAQDGPFADRLQIRARAIGVLPDESADISLIGGTVDIEDQWVPEVDFTWFFNDNVAVEVIAAVTPHDVKAVNTSLGEVDLGDVTLLPPTVTLQYHFNPGGTWRPYVGAGVNYTTFFDDDLPSGTALAGIDYDDSVGWAVQAGVDIYVDEHWFWNIDVKKIDISPDVKIDAGGGTIINADVDIDPVVIGVGFGYRF